MKKNTLAVLTLAAFGSLWSVPSSADEELKYKLTSHSTGFVMMEAGDGVDGHIIGSAKYVGVIFAEDGRIGLTSYLASIDYIKGNGTYVTTQIYKFDDGSVLRMRSSGSSHLENGKTTFPDGRSEVLGGTGRYKGAAGSGEFHGARINPIPDGGDSYFEGVVHIKGP